MLFQKSSEKGEFEEVPIDIPPLEPTEPTEHTVEITSSGFSPKTLKIKKGDTATWINKESSAWPASAIHPVHSAYPGSGLNKCGTAEETLIFDACKSLEIDESYSFTFNEIGEWKYHNHLKPSNVGTITVS